MVLELSKKCLKFSARKLLKFWNVLEIFKYVYLFRFYQRISIILRHWNEQRCKTLCFLNKISHYSLTDLFRLGGFNVPCYRPRETLENCSFIQLKIIYSCNLEYLKTGNVASRKVPPEWLDSLGEYSRINNRKNAANHKTIAISNVEGQ